MSPQEEKLDKDHKKLDLPRREKVKMKVKSHRIEGKTVILSVEVKDKDGHEKGTHEVKAPLEVLSSRPADQAEIRLKTALEKLAYTLSEKENEGKLDGFEYEF